MDGGLVSNGDYGDEIFWRSDSQRRLRALPPGDSSGVDRPAIVLDGSFEKGRIYEAVYVAYDREGGATAGMVDNFASRLEIG